MLYFDSNATAPLHPAARAAWLEVVDAAWHNPSGLYPWATVARERLEDARERLGDLLDAEPERIVFTGGATAAANRLARWLSGQASHDASVVTSGIEHPCVADSLAVAFGGRTEALPIDSSGVVIREGLEAALTAAPPELVAVMAASNESGVLQPWQQIRTICREHGVAFLCDASQWLGKLPAAGLGTCDWLIGSSHKFGGPRGTGFLVVPEASFFRGDHGGPQERGRHAGTEDVASVAAMVAALEAREVEMANIALRAAARDAAEQQLLAQLPDVVVVSGQAARLFNTLAVVIPGGDGKRIVAALGRAGIAASTGSACSAGAGSLPQVLAAIGADRLGLRPDDLRGMVRLSGGWETSAEEWLAVANALVAIVRGSAAGPPRVSLK